MDRPTGSLTVDPNGIANYQFPITVPPGSGHGNEPNLSLSFSHGIAANGILGSRWSLGGLSTIILVPPSTILNNNPTVKNNQTPFRYALDGDELLCTNGVYGAPGSTYMKELDDGNANVITLNTDGSFTLTNQFGCRSLYGSSSDSRIDVTLPDNSMVTAEWKLSRAYDSRSNYVQYLYQPTPPTTTPTTPTTQSTVSDAGISYLSCIQYTSNDSLGYSGKMKVNFYYDVRSDPVKATVWGRLTCTTHLLTTISTAVDSADGSSSYPARSYKLAYTTSPATGDSLLQLVTERGSADTELASTVFEYTGIAVEEWGANLFSQPQTIQSLDNTLGAQSLIPMNMTGRGYTDLVCLQFDASAQQMNLVHFVGDPVPDSTGSSWTMDWTAAQGNPAVFLASVPSPDQASLVVADVDNDGRTDAILAYNVSGSLQLSVTKSNGAGFDDAIQLQTSQPWAASDRYFVIDVSGSGTMDAVQISTASDGTQQISTFFDVNANLQSSILTALSSDTWQDSSEIIDWFPLRQQRHNTTLLVQVTQAPSQDGSNLVKANIFTASNGQPFAQKAFANSTTIDLLSYVPSATAQTSVLAVDINGDGVTDIVQCVYSFSQSGVNWSLTLTYQTFLFDGQSDFIRQDVAKYENIASGTGDVPAQGLFYVLNLDKSRYPCITFMYEDESHNWTTVYGMGTSAGQVAKPSTSIIAGGANNPNPGPWQIAPADVHGVGKAGLILQYFDSQTPCTVCPVYNTIDVSDFLSAITNPLGLRQEISYTPLSLPGFYDPGSGIEWQTYSAGDAGEDVNILGNSAYVVQQVRTLNEQSINAFPVGGAAQGNTGRIEQYSYAGGKVSRSGRGYLGFSSFIEQDQAFGTKQVSKISVSWPSIGKVLQQDIYGSSHANLLERLDKWPPLQNGDNMQWMQSIFTQYNTSQLVSDQSGPVQISNENNVPIWLTRETMTGSSFVQRNDLCIFGTDYTYVTNSNQKLTEHSFSRDETTGNILTEYWKHITPAPSIRGVQVLPGICKSTTSTTTQPPNVFVAGDLELKTFEYDQSTGTLFKSSIWSSDSNEFASTQHGFDEFGNQILEIDPGGLTTTTTFDPVYHAFPIKKTYTGTNVNMTEYYAYDPRYNKRFMVCCSYGNVELTLKDEFGRPSQIWRTASDPSDAQLASSVIQLPKCLVWDPNLATIFSRCSVNMTQEQTYNSITSTAGLKFLNKSRTLFNNATTISTGAAQEFIDAEGKVRKVKSQADGLVPVSWQYREYDSRGSQILESYATALPAGQDGADWTPGYQSCNCAVLDALERPVISIAPPAGPDLPFTSLETIYTVGDTHRSTFTRQPSSFIFNSSDAVVEELQYVFNRYDKKLRLLTQTAQSGLTQTYEYDALARLTNTIDAGGNIDVRSYNSLGCLSTVNNIYNNPTSPNLSEIGSNSPLGIINVYDGMGRLSTQANAMDEGTGFIFDAKGRLQTRVDPDNRVTQYSYDDPNVGIDKLASVTISVTPSSGPPQIESEYAYKYDPSGRVLSETLIITNGSAGSYTSSFTYDRQGHITKKILPDLSSLNYAWNGSHLASVTLKSPSGENWDLASTYSNFTPGGLAQNWALTGSNQSAANLTASTTYDLQDRPIERTKVSASGTSLVHYKLQFNALGQIHTNQEAVSDELITYEYSDQRLQTSISTVHGTSSYAYDNSGNMTEKAGSTLAYAKMTNGVGYSSIQINGTGGSFVCSYDAAGRVVSRQIPGGPQTTIGYDGYGKIRTCSTSTGTTTFLSDYTGQTIVKTGASETTEIYCGSDFSLVLQPGGTKLIKRNIFDASLRHIVATVTSQYNEQSNGVLGTQLDTYMTDHKGTVTHVFDGNGDLRRKLTYDDYGMLRSTNLGPDPGTLVTANADSLACMESKLQDSATGLVDFSGRWYDPCIGRFTTPDLTLQRKFIQQLDGANLCTFECNDPINRIDPSGHWNWNLFGAIAIAVVCVAASLLIPGSGLLVAAIAGALLGAGVASLSYGIKNRNNTNASSFWKGWGVDVAIGAATGFVTGGAGEWLSGAESISGVMGVSSDALTAAREAGTEATQFSSRWLVGVGGKTLLGGVSSVGQKVADTEAENAVGEPHQSLTWQDLMITGVEGAVGAGLSGLTKGVLGPEIKALKVAGKGTVTAFGGKIVSGLSQALTIGDDAVDDGGYTFTYSLFPQTGLMMLSD